MKKLLLAIVTVIMTAGVNLPAAQPKKGDFNYADHELKGDLADDIRKRIQQPWHIKHLPNFRDLNSDNWRVGEYNGKILKARQTEKVRFVNAREAAGRMRAQGQVLIADLIDNAYTNNPDRANAQFGIPYGSNQNLSRVRTAQSIQAVIDQKNKGNIAGVAKKSILKLHGEDYSDANCVIVADKVEGFSVYNFKVQELELLDDVVESTHFTDIHPGNFLRATNGKLMFIDTESGLDGVKERWSKSFLGSYMRWKIDHTGRAVGKNTISRYLRAYLMPTNMRNMNTEEREHLYETIQKVNKSYYKHRVLSMIEIPVTLSVLTGLLIRNKLYTRSDNKLLSTCVQAIRERVEAIQKDLELLSQEERIRFCEPNFI